ncbi:helix-turn-helix domain-containing protein [Paenibacillus polymyxa]|uniref:helix-turn-helix domain-containing protein n=1 Tax=Paenibacillus polymyxa TaxID=1406 RepID=UPI002377EDFE|nr:helix-turn-helix transcriptional regulator [Paenibacillus polymyxa]WDM23825.1 helix-turn-helix domain-containing protein [Paenibacillus polymyxa]
MNNINLKAMNKEQLVELYNDASKIIFADSKQYTKKFIEDSQDEWKEIGREYKQRRQLLQISLRKLSGMLGCSESKLRKWENGQPVQAADMLQHSYDMALELEMIKQGKQNYRKEIHNETTLSDKEVRAFYDILWNWIISEDNTYDLYTFIQFQMDGKDDPYFLLSNEESATLFSELLDYHLEQYECLDLYKEGFEKLKKGVEKEEKRLKLKGII